MIKLDKLYELRNPNGVLSEYVTPIFVDDTHCLYKCKGVGKKILLTKQLFIRTYSQVVEPPKFRVGQVVTRMGYGKYAGRRAVIKAEVEIDNVKHYLYEYVGGVKLLTRPIEAFEDQFGWAHAKAA